MMRWRSCRAISSICDCVHDSNTVSCLYHQQRQIDRDRTVYRVTMKTHFRPWFLLVTAGWLFSATFARSATQPVPGRFIIELERSHNVSSPSVIDYIPDTLRSIESNFGNISVLHQYDSEVFSGFSIQGHPALRMSQLLQISSWPIKAIYPVRRIPYPKRRSNFHHLDDSPKETPDSSFPLEPGMLVNHDGGLPLGQTYGLEDTFSPHVMTGVDKMHGAGLIGKGKLVCVIDSGIDYKLLALGGGFGKGYHVSVGSDFTGDAGGSADEDPFAQCTDHGTHISGIIGALSNPLNFTGVSPGSDLGMFRVFGCQGGVLQDTLLAAVLAAEESHCDVINLSLGNDGAFYDKSPVQIVINRLALKDQPILTTLAAGNAGEQGLYSTYSPAVTTHGLSAGSVDVVDQIAYSMEFDDDEIDSLPYLSIRPVSSNASFPIYALSTSTEFTPLGGACNPIPDSIDLKGRAVLVQRGACLFTTKLQNLKAAGAELMLIYNLDPMKPPLYLPSIPNLPPAISVRYSDAIKFIRTFKNDPKVRVSFQSKSILAHSTDTINGGLISSFSGRGPSAELFGQPNFCAPGGNILSTAPSNNGGALVESGTSMASAFVAGAAALLLSARKSERLTPDQVRALLVTTAEPIKASPGSSDLASTLLQGGGLIQVDRAALAQTLIEPDSISLNDSAFPQLKHQITITNLNAYPVTYRFQALVSQSLALYNKSSADIIPSTSPPVVTGSAQVHFDVDEIRIRGNSGSDTVTVTFKPPYFETHNQIRFPFYSGFIKITGDDVMEQEFTIPYFGMAGNMSDVPILDSTSQFARNYTYNKGNYQPLRYPFLTTATTSSQVLQTDPEQIVVYPKSSGLFISFRLAMPTRNYTVDLVAKDIDFQPTIPSSNNADLDGRSVLKSKLKAGLGLDINPLHSEPSERSMSSRALDIEKDYDQEIATDRSHASNRSEFSKSGTALYADTKSIGHIFTGDRVARSQGESLMEFTDLRLIFNGKVYGSFEDDATPRDVPSGVPYRILLRALRNTLNPTLAESWESWLSPPFSFSD